MKFDQQVAADLIRLSELIETDPAQAADELETMATGLLRVARKLRAATSGGALRSPAGMTDRLQMEVVGPDGQVRQRVDTDRREPS